MLRPLAGLLLCLSACSARGPATTARASTTADRTEAPAPPPVEVRGLEHIQRTLGLLEQSQAGGSREPVRVLFYGQSITQSAWSRSVEQTLRRRYPRADLQIENRSLGGFPAQLLVKAAESDLYSAYPDLVIFHVYGDHLRYEDIVRRLRERTTAELLLQTDHVTKPDELREESDPHKLAPRADQWSAFMNGAFLPGLAARYGAALCDQRGAWKRELSAHSLLPGALLLDEVHLNSLGDVLMASLVASCLRRAPAPAKAPAESWVQTLEVGRDVSWSERGELRLQFAGNRVDVVVRAGGTPLAVALDGARPSTHAALYTFARAHAREGGKWPPIYDLSTELADGARRMIETFTLEVQRVPSASLAQAEPATPAVYTFDVHSDQTGADGSGRSDTRFVSSSGRLVIDPEDWIVDYAFELAGQRPAPARFTIDLRVEPHFTDSVAPLPAATSGERAITLAQGLTNGLHELRITRAKGAAPSDAGDQVVALRVYRPPLDRSPH